MSQLVFDEQAAHDIESLYLIGDARRRRRIVRDALGAAPGQRVLDVGCGPGFYCVELSDDVGPSGSVVGVDSSEAMLALAARRCGPLANVELTPGEAVALPVPDEAFDAAVCVQVLEYVDDVAAGARELHRALRPGGRVAVWDIDWVTVSQHTEDPARAQRVWQAWDEHLVHRSLPGILAPVLRSAGFEDVGMQAHPFATARFDADSYGAAILPLIARFVLGRNGIDEAAAQAWLGEQRELGERGEFYFSITQFCFTATKAAVSAVAVALS